MTEKESAASRVEKLLEEFATAHLTWKAAEAGTPLGEEDLNLDGIKEQAAGWKDRRALKKKQILDIVRDQDAKIERLMRCANPIVRKIERDLEAKTKP